jgi:hypothetical protein
MFIMRGPQIAKPIIGLQTVTVELKPIEEIVDWHPN